MKEHKFIQPELLMNLCRRNKRSQDECRRIILHIKTVFINLFSNKIKKIRTQQKKQNNQQLVECTSVKENKSSSWSNMGGLYFHHSQIKHRFYIFIYRYIVLHIYIYKDIYIYFDSFSYTPSGNN